MYNFKFTLFGLLFLSTTLLSSELVIVKKVSAAKKTFLISRGILDGVAVKQKALFTTNKISLLAEAINVSRDYSLWELTEKNTIVPFDTDEVVTFNNSSESIWTELERLRHTIKAEFVAQAREEELSFKMGAEESFLLRGNYSRGLSSTTSDAGPASEPTRSGYQGEWLYSSLITPKTEFTCGFRYDYEVGFVQDLGLYMPTNRYFLTSGLIYHFPNFEDSKNNLYFGLDFGIGRSTTKVEASTKSGFVTILPSVRFGIELPFLEKRALMLESVVETLSSSEKFQTGKLQTTKTVNAKMGLALRF